MLFFDSLISMAYWREEGEVNGMEWNLRLRLRYIFCFVVESFCELEFYYPRA